MLLDVSKVNHIKSYSAQKDLMLMQLGMCEKEFKGYILWYIQLKIFHCFNLFNAFLDRECVK